jgi:acetylornithine/LysW-gamma-L-lysine aminotransferase
MEGALKIARIATGRTGVVAAERGFHGRTMGALSCTWDPKYRAPFEPLVPGVVHAPHGDLAAFEARIGGDTAAVVVEVVQGEGGVRPTNAAFLQGLRRLCTERGALLVIDEVQTGFGRTGRVFAFEHFGIEPDLLALGKAIGGGLPMGAVAFGSAVGELPVGSHGSTFGGNPLACAAAVAALDVLEQERLPERAEALGARFRSRLGAIASPRVREVRGLGLMVAVELDVPSAPYLAALLERGVIALAAGPTVVRFLPPLVVAEEDLEFAADALEEVLALVPDPAAPSTARS